MRSTFSRERFPQLFSGLLALSLALVAGSFISATAVSDSGIYDTSSLDKDITAVVSVEFGVE